MASGLAASLLADFPRHVVVPVDDQRRLMQLSGAVGNDNRRAGILSGRKLTTAEDADDT